MRALDLDLQDEAEADERAGRDRAVGTLLLATGTVQAGGLAVLTYTAVGRSGDPPWPATAIASAVGDVVYTAPFLIALIGIPLLFPDGRLPSPRFRWVPVAVVAGLGLMLATDLVSLIPGLQEVS